MQGTTERGTEPYSMYGEYWNDRVTQQCAAFHGTSTNPANFQYSLHIRALSFSYLAILITKLINNYSIFIDGVNFLNIIEYQI